MSRYRYWTRFTTRERIGLALVMVVLVAGALWRFVWLPIQVRNEAMWAERVEQTALAHQLAQAPADSAPGTVPTAEQLHASLIAAEVEITRIEVTERRAQLSLAGAAPSLWPWLEGLARSGVTLEQVSVHAEDDRLRVTLALTGLARPD